MRIRRDRAYGPDVRQAVLPARWVEGAAAGAAHDAELGRMFHNMRVAMQVSRETIARRLATAVATVDSFEAGAVATFPRWPETERIVRGYCELLRLDPDPVLWRIRGRLGALSQQHPAPVAPPSARPPAASRVNASRDLPTKRRSWRKAARALLLAGPLALAALLFGLAQAAPLALYRAVAALPATLRGPVRLGVDQLVLLSAARREGLIWVDVGDPRARKADRLRPPL